MYLNTKQPPPQILIPYLLLYKTYTQIYGIGQQFLGCSPSNVELCWENCWTKKEIFNAFLITQKAFNLIPMVAARLKDSSSNNTPSEKGG